MNVIQDFRFRRTHTARSAECLTPVERESLETAEQTVKDGVGTFVQVGLALCEIRDSRLYREEFHTFEKYCEARWNLSRRRSYQLIEGAQVASQMPSDVVLNEAQARALSKVPSSARIEFLRRVVSAARTARVKVTASFIKQRAQEAHA